jgi:hypothetical protein
VAATLAGAGDQLVTLPTVPTVVRSREQGTTAQADAEIGEAEREALGALEVSAVFKGVELGVDVVGIEPELEARLRMFADADGHLVELPLVPVVASTGVLSATLPWSAGLPGEVVVAVAPTRSPEGGPSEPPRC